MKRAIKYAVIFGVIASLIEFILIKFFNFNNMMVGSVMVVIFVTLGTMLGIFKETKEKAKTEKNDYYPFK